MTYNEQARQIVSRRINQICMMDIDDLPDVSEICDIVESIADVLEEYEYEKGQVVHVNCKQEVQELLREIDFEFIQDLIMG